MLLRLAKAAVVVSASALAACGGASSTQDESAPPLGGAAADDGGVVEPSQTCALQTCGGRCVDVAKDQENCGACGHRCDESRSCQAGVCVLPLDLCHAATPSGRISAPPPPAYYGTCPSFAPGRNVIRSTYGDRSFLLVLPSALNADEKLPLVFLWHWLGGSANSFLIKAEVQAAVDTQRFAAVIPETKGDLLLKWPFSVLDSDQRLEEEFRFFDDLLACVSSQSSFAINRDCVSSIGVSAGALFTGQLAGARSQYLASALSLSGGVGDAIRPWRNPARRLPLMVLWGGDLDHCVALQDFVSTSQQLEQALANQGNFFLECIHNCGHSAPPFETPPGLSYFASIWQFVFDHPYWLQAGESPYRERGIPATLPAWCGIGQGSATPRQGECSNSSGC